MLHKKNFFITLILLILFLTAAQVVLIQDVQADSKLWSLVQKGGLDQFSAEVYGTEKPRDIRLVAILVVKAFLGLIGTIFLINIVIAGYKWMTAAGGEDKITEAKKQIQHGVIGLIIILMSYAITDLIMDCFYDAVTGDTVWFCE